MNVAVEKLDNLVAVVKIQARNYIDIILSNIIIIINITHQHQSS